MLLRRRRSNVDEAVQQLRSQGLEVTGCVCHVGDATHRKQLVQRTLEVRGLEACMD
jgi:dehydrogenase/reductase SDR family protein 4